jgi:hypothetical protein
MTPEIAAVMFAFGFFVVLIISWAQADKIREQHYIIQAQETIIRQFVAERTERQEGVK